MNFNMDSNVKFDDKKRIADLLASIHGGNSELYIRQIIYVAEGSYTRIYRYKDSAFKIDWGTFKPSKITQDNYVDENILREIVGYQGIPPHDSIVKVITTHYDSKGIIVEMERMSCDLGASLIADRMDSRLFEQILHSLLNAIEHLHSYGILHGDIKPANVLAKFGNEINNEMYVKIALCDMNIVQYIPYNGIDNKFTLHGTPYYIPKGSAEHRSFGVDIYMIGATLVDIILKKCGKVHINLEYLLQKKDTIEIYVGERNYQILCLMLERLPSRPYIRHIREYLTDKDRMPFEIYAGQGRDLTINDDSIMPQFYRKDEIELSDYMTNGYCTPRYLFEEGLTHYQNSILQRMRQIYTKIEADFATVVKDKIVKEGCEKFRANLGIRNYDLSTVNTIDCVYNQILDMGIRSSAAMFVAQSLVLFPGSIDPDQWLRSYAVESNEVFNKEILKILGFLRDGKFKVILAPSIDQHIGYAIDADQYKSEDENSDDSDTESETETDTESYTYSTSESIDTHGTIFDAMTHDTDDANNLEELDDTDEDESHNNETYPNIYSGMGEPNHTMIDNCDFEKEILLDKKQDEPSKSRTILGTVGRFISSIWRRGSKRSNRSDAYTYSDVESDTDSDTESSTDSSSEYQIQSSTDSSSEYRILQSSSPSQLPSELNSRIYEVGEMTINIDADGRLLVSGSERMRNDMSGSEDSNKRINM